MGYEIIVSSMIGALLNFKRHLDNKSIAAGEVFTKLPTPGA